MRLAGAPLEALLASELALARSSVLRLPGQFLAMQAEARCGLPRSLSGRAEQPAREEVPRVQAGHSIGHALRPGHRQEAPRAGSHASVEVYASAIAAAHEWVAGTGKFDAHLLHLDDAGGMPTASEIPKGQLETGLGIVGP